jgi:hypothetical protein
MIWNSYFSGTTVLLNNMLYLSCIYNTLYNTCKYNSEGRSSVLSGHWMNFYHHKEDGQVHFIF